MFASIANFLSHVGWRRDQGWGDEVMLPAGLEAPADSHGARRPVAEWSALGVRRVDGTALPPVASDAALIAPGGADGPVFLVYDNFRALLKWNNSSYFAIAVGFLADDIERQ